MNDFLLTLTIVGPIGETQAFKHFIALRDNQCRGDRPAPKAESAHEKLSFEALQNDMQYLYKKSQDFPSDSLVHPQMFAEWIDAEKPTATLTEPNTTSGKYCLYRFLNACIPHLEAPETMQISDLPILQRMRATTQYWSSTSTPAHAYDWKATETQGCLTMHSLWGNSNREHPFEFLYSFPLEEFLPNSYIFFSAAYSDQASSIALYRKPGNNNLEKIHEIGPILTNTNEHENCFSRHTFQTMRDLKRSGIPLDILEFLFGTTMEVQRPFYIEGLENLRTDRRQQRINRLKEKDLLAGGQNLTQENIPF